jgi:hypothetical protein
VLWEGGEGQGWCVEYGGAEDQRTNGDNAADSSTHMYLLPAASQPDEGQQLTGGHKRTGPAPGPMVGSVVSSPGEVHDWSDQTAQTAQTARPGLAVLEQRLHRLPSPRFPFLPFRSQATYTQVRSLPTNLNKCLST